ncbi:alpha/beta fold hydrolase [Saccharopolyspora sp. ASAGF58]|uniref:alpha/beta fold hydrolase n=1 Tax=Saccharopolyspora sp. ASAGF58 TaxID=2719023 RepID=UPI001FF0C9CF|nr:alpha/beta fold hydrolase [Saccharopolyspora sp. ASAGF58]
MSPGRSRRWRDAPRVSKPSGPNTGPALVVVGEEDTLTPPENARELAGALSGSELVTLPGAGHLPSIESPDAFAEAVRPRLSRLG